MKEEHSVSKETLVNLESGGGCLPQNHHYEKAKGKLSMANSGWKEIFRIASFILYVQLILFVGWASYTIWDNYRLRPVEATVRSHLVIHASASSPPPLPPSPAASYSPGDDSLNEKLLKVTEVDGLGDVVQDSWLVLLLVGRGASLSPLRQMEAGAEAGAGDGDGDGDGEPVLQGNNLDETIPREKVAVDSSKNDESSRGGEEESGLKRWGEFADSSESDESDEVGAWYARKDLIDWNLAPFLWSISAFENSAQEDSEPERSPVQSGGQASEKSDATSLADESGLLDSPETSHLFPEVDKSVRASQAEENSASSDHQQEQQQQQQQQLNAESELPIYQGYRKYKCAYHIEGGLKCEIMEPSVKTNEESSERPESKKYLTNKQASEEEESDIFGGEDFTDDFEDDIYEDWKLLLGLKQHFPINLNIGGHDGAEAIESGGKLEESSSVDSWTVRDNETRETHSDSQGNGYSTEKADNIRENGTSIDFSGELGHENSEGRVMATEEPEKSPPPHQGNEEASDAKDTRHINSRFLSSLQTERAQ